MDELALVKKLLYNRKQAIIEADGAWNPYDEVITEAEWDAIEYLCASRTRLTALMKTISKENQHGLSNSKP